MNRKVILLTLVFLLSAMIGTSSAQTRVVGVSEGDWFKYGDVSSSWTSSDPNATIPNVYLNETEWGMISIVDVSGTNVTGQMTTHFKNGTEETVGGYVDIETGEGKNMTIFVISANLGENDMVFTSGELSFARINETIVRTYPDGVRETNHLNLTVEFSYVEFYQYLSTNYYWDKATGILVEMSQDERHQTGEYITNSSLLFRITESNVWVVPEFPSFLILPPFIIATLLAVLFYKRKILDNQ